MLTTRTAGPGVELPDDAGISMIEMIIAIALSLVVGGLAVAFMLSATDGTRRADGQNEQAAAARTALDAWSRLLRLAVDPVGSSSPGTARLLTVGPARAELCVAVDSKADDPADDPLPIGVTLTLATGQLVEERWATCADMLAGSPADVRRVLANDVGRAGPTTWLVTPLKITDIPTGIQGELLVSTLVHDDVVLEVTSPGGHDAITQTAALQLAFRTLGDPRRPAPSTIYSTVITLTAGG